MDPFGPMNRTRSRYAASGCPPGSAGVPPAPYWQGLAHLLHPARPATAPGLYFGRGHAVPAGRVAGRAIPGELSGTQRHSMRAGRPRSRVAASSHRSCSSRGAGAGLAGRTPADAAASSRLVALRGSLLFRLIPENLAKSRFNSEVLHALRRLMMGGSQKKAPALNEPGPVKQLPSIKTRMRG